MSLEFPIITLGGSSYEFTSGELPDTITPKFVLAFVFHSDAILLAYVPERGWCAPSGKIEEGETPVDAVKRESREEAGVDPESPGPFGYFQIVSKTGSVAYAVAFSCLCDGRITLPLQHESTASKFCPINQLADIYYEWNPLFDQVIQLAAIKSNEISTYSPEP